MSSAGPCTWAGSSGTTAEPYGWPILRSFVRTRHRPHRVTCQRAARGWLVQTLAVDPYALDGDVVIPLDQVVLVGTVVAGSGLEGAYLQAIDSSPGSSPAP